MPRTRRCIIKGCARQGVGEPSLCQIHIQQFYPEADTGDDQDPLGVVLDRLMQDNRVRDAFSAVAGRVDAFSAFLGRIGQRKQPQPGQQQRQAPPPWGQQAKPRETPGDSARRIMGFAHGQVLTRDEIKKRYRELAKANHPDKGGDPWKMALINRANEVLMKEIGG